MLTGSRELYAVIGGPLSQSMGQNFITEYIKTFFMPTEEEKVFWIDIVK